MEASCRRLQAAACPAHFPLPSLVFKTHFATEHGAPLPWELGAVGRMATRRAWGVGTERSALGWSQRSRPRVRCLVSLSVVSKQVLGAAILPPSFAKEPGLSLSGPEGGTDFSRLLVGTRAGASGSLSAIVGGHRLAQLVSIAWPQRTGEALSAGVWPSAFAGGEGGECAEAGRAWAGGREQEKVHRVGGSQEPSLTCPSCLARLDNSSIFVVPTPCQVGVWVAMFVQ